MLKPTFLSWLFFNFVKKHLVYLHRDTTTYIFIY
ncbi:hypothetical protein J2Z57_001082 [Formosa algae]|jgi:hypothetical protein|uniref:Uncharacterized protein n=1 Tax=Formosa algae TaxID=225843 RepID=A0A9X1CBL3_9FLAO|nr:hypothetical protein [Formosa algae]MDQ0334649.1 hypothetical protein [Formosa algae]